jgi:hypothetical protein
MKIILRIYLVGMVAYLLLVASPALAQNIALGKPTLTSLPPVQVAANAFDGNSNTRWESPASDPQYIIVDLGSVQSIDRIRLSWETALGKDFTLAISAITAAPSDAQWTNVLTGSWAVVKTITGNAVTTNDYPNLGQSGRYVRLNGTARGTSYGYSLYEFAVYPDNPSSNLALAKSVTTSSTPLQEAENALDGDGRTRWESPYSDPQVIMVDLGSVRTIDRIRLTWESALGKDFTLEVSDDGAAWQLAVAVTGNASTANEYPNLAASGRYVRLTGTVRGTSYGYSLYEFEVFATSSSAVNLANGKRATASSTQGGLSPGYAFDNDRLTRWASTAGREDASIYVDLLSPTSISRVYLVWEKAYGGDFTIDISQDAATWNTIATVANNSLQFNELIFPTPATGRYVRLHGTRRGTTSADNGYSLYEFEVNSPPRPLPVTLTGFSATLQGMGVTVKWTTTSEQHNAGFQVQRASLDEEFTTLATIGGIDTTEYPHSYRYFDAVPLATTTYYRLKQFDIDSTYTYSPVVAVPALKGATSTTSLAIRSYPNPTTSRATVTWDMPVKAPGRWYLINTLGQVVHAETLSGGMTTTLTLDLQAYPTGPYLLVVESGSQVAGRGWVQKAN